MVIWLTHHPPQMTTWFNEWPLSLSCYADDGCLSDARWKQNIGSAFPQKILKITWKLKHIPYFPDRLNGAYDFNSFEFFFFFYSDDLTQYRIQQKFYSKVLWMRVFLWHLSPTFKMTSLPNRIKLIYSHIFVNHLSFFPLWNWILFRA